MVFAELGELIFNGVTHGTGLLHDAPHAVSNFFGSTVPDFLTDHAAKGLEHIAPGFGKNGQLAPEILDKIQGSIKQFKDFFPDIVRTGEASLGTIAGILGIKGIAKNTAKVAGKEALEQFSRVSEGPSINLSELFRVLQNKPKSPYEKVIHAALAEHNIGNVANM